MRSTTAAPRTQVALSMMHLDGEGKAKCIGFHVFERSRLAASAGHGEVLLHREQPGVFILHVYLASNP